MEVVLWAIGIMTILGVVFAIGLFVASKKFQIETDPRIEEVLDILPHVNCGACGYGGCPAAAEAIVQGKVDAAACPVGGAEVARKIADILGVEFKEREREVAVLLCKGKGVPWRYEYAGVEDCRAAVLAQGGPKACEYGCIGFGTCAEACQFDALHMDPDGLPVVDEEKCVACRACERICPLDLFKVLPEKKYVHVICRSHHKGARVRKICEFGCIACKKCEKACEFDAIHVTDFLAEIDYEKCTNCGKCVQECPVEVIRNFRKERRERRKAREEAVVSSPVA